MPKKIDSAKGNNASNKAHSPMKDRTRKPGQGEASYGGGDHEKKDREMKSTGGNKNPFDDIGKPTGGVGQSTGNDDNVFSDIKKMSGGKRSKDGCLPKFTMLLLSIVAGAAYVFLGS